MTRQKYNKMIGDAGEELVFLLLKNLGRNPSYSNDYYDAEKDILCEGKTVEVKTEQPFVKKNAFTFHKSQLKKCRNVDELYIVSVPPRINQNYKHGGKIFRAIPSLFEYFEYTLNNKPMIGIPIEQPCVIEVARIPKDRIDWFNQHTVSDY